MTAVQYILEQYEKYLDSEIIHEALYIENQQLDDAWHNGYQAAKNDIISNKLSTFEEYQKIQNG